MTYMEKPVKHMEMLARIGACSRCLEAGDQSKAVVEFQPYLIDRTRRCVAHSGSHIKLTEKEYELTDSLQQPVTECIKTTARKDTQIFADALTPVIMPARRRRFIAEALRTFVHSYQ
jgi:hypothetical protein